MTAMTRQRPFTIVPLFSFGFDLCQPKLQFCAAISAGCQDPAEPPFPASPPSPLKKFGQNGYYRQGGAGGSCGNTWKPVDGDCKLLFSLANRSTGLHFFYTGSAQYSTCCPVFSTRPVLWFFALSLCISLFLKEKKNKKRRKRENSHPRETTIAYFLIHGLSGLFRPTRGYPWKQLSFVFSGLSDKNAPSTGPRVVLPPGGENRG